MKTSSVHSGLNSMKSVPDSEVVIGLSLGSTSGKPQGLLLRVSAWLSFGSLCVCEEQQEWQRCS